MHLSMTWPTTGMGGGYRGFDRQMSHPWGNYSKKQGDGDTEYLTQPFMQQETKPMYSAISLF